MYFRFFRNRVFLPGELMAFTPHLILRLYDNKAFNNVLKLNRRTKMSTVFRVVKNSNYTTLSNYHFRDKRLSWKAKGLLSTMLSLPDDWNYTIEGLAKLSDDGIKSTNSGLAELEKCGYLIRKQLRNENGYFSATEYTIYEQPIQEDNPEEELTEPIADPYSQPLCQNGQTDENKGFQPFVQKRQTEKRISEKGRQLNTNILNTKELINSSSIHSDDIQKEMRKTRILDDEDRNKLWKQFELERVAEKCSHALTNAVFIELCKRDPEFISFMNGRAFEQVCMSIMEIQKREPVRMLPNLINTCMDNIVCGIKAASGAGCRNGPSNAFNNFKQQNQYDFEALEKDILSN